MKILDRIKSPADLRALPQAELAALAAGIRQEIVATVSRTGGHLASSLGAVELAIAVHYVFDTPSDMVVWDVGHQTYAHKLLTGRAAKFQTLRGLGGLSGFPNRDESPEHDLFTSGHSSTSISTALGLAVSRDLRGGSEKIVAVIGDAALAGGMAFEALNHAGHAQKDIIVILNDNELSISQSVGALSKYLNRIITNPAYNRIRKDIEKVLKRIPRFGFRAYRAARKLEEGLKNLLIPGMLFEEMGFRYFGPIDGHNLDLLINDFRNLKDLNEPVLIHVVTKKGKGYKPAEDDPSAFHGTGPFDPATGRKAGSGALPGFTPQPEGHTREGVDELPSGGIRPHGMEMDPEKKETMAVRPWSFTAAFGEKIVELARKDPGIVGVTAAMIDGTGFNRFASLFPDRFFDVGIAEEHAVGFSAGLARGSFRPVVAIYSTFLQRGYDQIIHDVCLQNLPVVFCLDRAGLAGEDGPTHHGAFDIAYLRHIPNLVLMAPSTPAELGPMLELAVTLNVPVAIRYPKGGSSLEGVPQAPVEAGRARTLRDGRDAAIIAVGCMAEAALAAADLLAARRVSATVVDARFIKPLDEALIVDVCRRHRRIVTVEDGVLDGGFGSAVLEAVERAGLKGVDLRRMGLPDVFIEHGSRAELFSKYSLTPQSICDVISRG
jgi:1-deoxy-D-xylulose-5-phosphate synthase